MDKNKAQPKWATLEARVMLEVRVTLEARVTVEARVTLEVRVTLEAWVKPATAQRLFSSLKRVCVPS